MSPEERARGRRLAILSHPAGMVHWTVYTESVPTLALLSLGASEALIGVQRALMPLAQLLQLPVLKAVGRIPKRRILLAGQALAVLFGIPLVAFPWLASLPGEWPLRAAMGSLVLTTAWLVTAQTVWWPMLSAYQEPGRFGRFFGALRTGWHLVLLAYFLAARAWMERHPEDFAALFGVGAACGVLRLLLVRDLPERSERTGEPLRVRDALALLKGDPGFRGYLLRVGLRGGLYAAALPFVVVWMRRVLGFSEGEVLAVTAAGYAGGLCTLYLWGRVSDQAGPERVMRDCSFALGLLLLGMACWVGVFPAPLPFFAVFFFLQAALQAGFGVAEVNALFRRAPAEAPTKVLVLAGVVTNLCRGLAPLAAGFLLDGLLSGAPSQGGIYRTYFWAVSGMMLAASVTLPPSGVREPPASPDVEP